MPFEALWRALNGVLRCSRRDGVPPLAERSFAGGVLPCPSAPDFNAVGQPFGAKLSASFMVDVVLGHAQMRAN